MLYNNPVDSTQTSINANIFLLTSMIYQQELNIVNKFNAGPETPWGH